MERLEPQSTEASCGAILAWKNSRRINIQGGLNGRTFGASFVCLQIFDRDNSLWFDKRHVSVGQSEDENSDVLSVRNVVDVFLSFSDLVSVRLCLFILTPVMCNFLYYSIIHALL